MRKQFSSNLRVDGKELCFAEVARLVDGSVTAMSDGRHVQMRVLQRTRDIEFLVDDLGIHSRRFKPMSRGNSW